MTNPDGLPVIWLFPRLPEAPFGTPTASPEVEGSLPRVVAIIGREFRTKEVRDGDKIRLVVIVGHRFVFCLGFTTYKQIRSIAHLEFNI